jgi:hypothetical protein
VVNTEVAIYGGTVREIRYVQGNCIFLGHQVQVVVATRCKIITTRPG